MSKSRPLLLVEDNPDDVFFFRRALKSKGIDVPLIVATDGREAMDYLSGKGDYANREQYPLPMLALLDLQLPYFTGHQVVSWMREDPLLKRIPAVIFSSSSLARDIDEAYARGVNSYLVKPTDAAELGRIVDAIRTYWLEINHGPSGLGS